MFVNQQVDERRVTVLGGQMQRRHAQLVGAAPR